MSHLNSLISSLKPSSTFMGRKPLSSSLAEGMQGKEKKKPGSMKLHWESSPKNHGAL